MISNRIKKQIAVLKITTDESATVYIDGMQVLKTEIYKTYAVQIDSSFRVIAIFVTNIFDNIGIMAETSTGIVTNKSWKCTDQIPRQSWTTENFDDSSWPKAVILAVNKGGNGFMPQFNDFPAKRLWISMQNMRAQRMYCRKIVTKTE